MDHELRIYDNIFEMMPDERNPTPIVRISKMNPSKDYLLYAKLEWANPFGSVKDRAAWAMLLDLERRGLLGPGREIVEPTSGNTGMSLAGMASARGYKMRAVVPNRVPLEKKVLLKVLGAELDVVPDDICPSPAVAEGSINRAKTYAKVASDRYVMPNQYENWNNVEAHYRTTGPEIWRQTHGQVTHVFVAMGTCGTAMGISKFMREQERKVKIVAVQPSANHDVPGLRSIGELDVSKLFDPAMVDEILEVDYRLAYQRACDLCQKEGLLASPSCGLVYEGAREVIEREKTGFGVMIFADNVLKYTSRMMAHLPELDPGQ
ncbi:MAG TPA: cysteine synthase family protein [Planctomycetota bacterium]|jgi:cysteine synthase